jgi:hypothetical protein
MKDGGVDDENRRLEDALHISGRDSEDHRLLATIEQSRSLKFHVPMFRCLFPVAFCCDVGVASFRRE